MSDDDQLPSTAADFFLLAQLAARQAGSTRHPKTVRVLLRMARQYLERARALGWNLPPEAGDHWPDRVAPGELDGPYVVRR
jgi:hypothetical protein